MGNRQLRIALIMPGFSASADDWCIPALLNLVRELARVHDVHVFTLRYPHQREVYTVHRATVHAFGGGTLAGVRRGPLLARALAAVVRAGRRRPFDVIHGFWADEPGLLAVAAGRLLGRPSVVSIMGGELVGFADIDYGGQLSRLNRWMTQIALQGAERVTVGSNTVAVLAEPYVPALERLKRTPLGVDAAMFTPPHERPSRLPYRVLHVASLTPVKEQVVLLRAFMHVASVLGDEVELHLVGSGPLHDQLERVAVALGITEQVVIHGDVAHDDLPAHYRSADVFVLSSRYESQSLVALEAAACGLPGVGTAVGVLPELGPACVTVPVGDVDALAEAIVRLLEDDDCRHSMGATARTQIEREFALSCTVRKLAQVYDEVVADDSVGAPLPL